MKRAPYLCSEINVIGTKNTLTAGTPCTPYGWILPPGFKGINGKAIYTNYRKISGSCLTVRFPSIVYGFSPRKGLQGHKT